MELLFQGKKYAHFNNIDLEGHVEQSWEQMFSLFRLDYGL